TPEHSVRCHLEPAQRREIASERLAARGGDVLGGGAGGDGLGATRTATATMAAPVQTEQATTTTPPTPVPADQPTQEDQQ
ncbi:MAG: hypothetical protein ABI807_13175, partial [Sporichthyaceae bacterium]